MFTYLNKYSIYYYYITLFQAALKPHLSIYNISVLEKEEGLKNTSLFSQTQFESLDRELLVSTVYSNMYVVPASSPAS